MPQLRKVALSQFIRTECLRQLRLNLSPPTRAFIEEREREDMPPKQPPRPGFEQLVRAGHEWQAAKILDLAKTFGPAVVVGDRRVNSKNEVSYHPIDLIDILVSVPPGTFLVEAEFDVGGTFKRSLGVEDYGDRFDLSYARLRPDIIEVSSPDENRKREFAERYILPDGDVCTLPTGDPRLQLRIIDVKLTAEPSPEHFAEVTYYSMALAGWLTDVGLDDRYVVVPYAAVWPGSHDASVLVQTARKIEEERGTPTTDELRNAMEDDLELAPFEVFASRVRQFLLKDIPRVLSGPWEDLPWHVDNRCKGCDWVGYLNWFNREGQPTYLPKHCIPLAKQSGHLSRIAFLSRGARCTLEENAILDVTALANLAPRDRTFDAHYNLRAMRSVVAGRATSLQEQRAFIPQHGGTSAVMPKWADLHVYVAVNFDVGSAITFAMGLDAFWVEPRPFGTEGPRVTFPWRARTFIVDQRDLAVEQRELLSFLRQLNEIIADAYMRNKKTKIQLYVWDSIQYKHLTRIIGRHLSAILDDQSISHLAWLFPSEELVPNAKMETRRSPITIVKEVIRSLVAAPVPHYYTLFEVARVYHHRSLREGDAEFRVFELFEDQLSDQIPSERAHEIWARTERWADRLYTLQRIVRQQLQALQTITRRLEEDLRPYLQQIAPIIDITPPDYQSGISTDGQLWYAFAKLDAALSELDVHQTRAMPPEEREARFRSARLERRLVGREADDALRRLDLATQPRRRVYLMCPNSKDVKLREGDFGVALAPETDVGFLDRLLQLVTQNTDLERPDGSGWRIRMERVTRVSVVAIDRDAGILVLDPDYEDGEWLDELEAYNLVDFSQNVILDPVSLDYFTERLQLILKAIKNPANAREDPIIKRAIGSTWKRKGRKTVDTPAGDVLWSPTTLAESLIPRELDAAQAILESEGIKLNPSQERAWKLALTRRLQLIWGPPGTGKSLTLRAVALGALLDASQQERAIRVLVCAPTYRALDNVLLEVNTLITDQAGHIGRALADFNVDVFRTRSMRRASEERIPARIDLQLTAANASRLRGQLEHPVGNIVVGATPEQVFKLLKKEGRVDTAPLFDLIILDEASQMDVAHAILPIASIAKTGSLVIAGDPMQLPPIHQPKPPEGLEHMVGSVCCFFNRIHKIKPADLQVNYRSNQTIVEFAHKAGYRRELQSFSPELCVNLVEGLPSVKPSNWPESLQWTNNWSLLLNPSHHAACFVYPEGVSAQSNLFEADAVAALAFLLFKRLGNQLLHERDFSTQKERWVIPETYSDRDFWEKGVGIVTPHRAQQALIIARLQTVFAPFNIQSSLIRGAVDTVERFQGQERDVVIASYALGDQDAIRDEDEFLMSLNRFNVMVSRARAKIITLVSQEVVNHLPRDIDVLRESRLLKLYADSFCKTSERMVLEYFEDQNAPKLVPGFYKYHQ